jgi:hypothetical protein
MKIIFTFLLFFAATSSQQAFPMFEKSKLESNNSAGEPVIKTEGGIGPNDSSNIQRANFSCKQTIQDNNGNSQTPSNPFSKTKMEELSQTPIAPIASSASLELPVITESQARILEHGSLVGVPVEQVSSLIGSLRAVLNKHPEASRFIINNGTIQPHSNSWISWITTWNSGNGTMASLRAEIDKLGLGGSLNNHALLQDVLPRHFHHLRGPEPVYLSAKEDPLTRGRLGAIIHLLEDHAGNETTPQVDHDFASAIDGEEEVSDTWKETALSDQDKFEETLKQITRGEGSFKGKFLTPTFIKKTLDGIEMLALLADGKIHFPLEEPSLSDVSLEETLGAIAFALHDNVEQIDQEIAELRKPIQERKETPNHPHYSGNSIECLESYKGALEKGKEMLLSIQQDGSEDSEFCLKAVSGLHRIFALLESILKAEAKGDFQQSFELKDYVSAHFFLLEENLIRPNPLEAMVDGYEYVIKLFGKAFAAQAEKNDKETKCFSRQASVYLKFENEYLKPDSRRRKNIVVGYKRSKGYFSAAEEALALQKKKNPHRSTPDTARISHLNNAYDILMTGGDIYLNLTHEQAKEGPDRREDIISSYQQALDELTEQLDSAFTCVGLQPVRLEEFRHRLW